MTELGTDQPVDTTLTNGGDDQGASGRVSTQALDLPNDLTFREAMNELNQIVEALESNTLELEESLVKYERGIKLLRFLKQSLHDAQQKVDVLMGELDTSADDATTDSTLSKA